MDKLTIRLKLASGVAIAVVIIVVYLHVALKTRDDGPDTIARYRGDEQLRLMWE